MPTEKRFDHKYRSCARTYATICIYHKTLDPEQLSEILKMQPDDFIRAGDVLALNRKAPSNGWFYGTEEKKTISKSRDMRAHVEWLLDKFASKKRELRKLTKLNCEMDISCFWESSSGNGGPLLDQTFIKKLSEFPFELKFDIYFEGE